MSYSCRSGLPCCYLQVEAQKKYVSEGENISEVGVVIVKRMSVDVDLLELPSQVWRNASHEVWLVLGERDLS